MKTETDSQEFSPISKFNKKPNCQIIIIKKKLISLNSSFDHIEFLS